MYHEGWWGPFYNRLLYLIPGTAFLALTLVGIRWPRAGGWLIIVIGGLFTISFLDISIVDGKLTIGRDMAGFMVSGHQSLCSPRESGGHCVLAVQRL